MGLKLAVLVAVLVDMKVESTTLPCSFLLTYIFESRILIWVREIPDCIKFHLSFSRIDSIFRCSVDMKGLIKYGLFRLPLFARTLETSAILTKCTRIGLGLVLLYLGSNLPRR